MIDIPCVILAGGKSSRMKQDKCFLAFKNTTLIKYQYDRLNQIFKNVYISSKVNKFDFPSKLILEQNDIFSPMVALQSILLKNGKVFIISVDTPNISKSTINKLIDMSNNFDITIPKTKDNKTHNLCGVFKSSINTKIDEMIKDNNHKIGFLIKSVNSKIIDGFDNDEFVNLNTKDDYLKFIQ